MNKKVIYLFFFQIFYSSDCLQQWYASNPLNEEIIHISAVSNIFKENNSINIYIEKNKRYKIEFSDKIILSDTFKISNYSKSTNQLFIEKPDKNFNKFIFSLLDYQKLVNRLTKKLKNKFVFKNFNGQSFHINFDESCESFQVEFEMNQKVYLINQIKVKNYTEMSSDNLFDYDFKDDEVFKYDFRKN